MTKKHLTLPVKTLLFICFSALYVLTFLGAVSTERAVINICVKQNLDYLYSHGVTISLILTLCVMFIGLLLLIIAETVLYKRTDIPDGFFIPLPFAITLFFVIYVFLCKNFTGSFYDGEMLFLYFAVLGIIKAVYDIIRLIKIKRYTLIPICLLSLAGTFLCFFSPYLYEEYRIYTESISAPPFLNL